MPYFVDCESSGQYTSGHTVMAAMSVFRQVPNCLAAEEPDLPAFNNWIKDMIQRSS